MAITYTVVLDNNRYTHTYLFEPYLLKLQTDEPSAVEFKVNVSLKSPTTADFNLDSILDYARLVLDSTGTTVVDVHKLIRPFLQREWYRIGEVSDITWETILAQGWYSVAFYAVDSTGATVDSTSTFRTPIIGGRQFKGIGAIGFGILPTGETKEMWLTDWDYNGIKQPEWIGQPIIDSDIVYTSGSINTQDIRPTVTISTPITGRTACEGGGYLIWKSQYGGWNSYAFNIKTETETLRYLGNLDSEEIDVVSIVTGATPCVRADYVQTETMSKISLKAVGVSNIEAKVLKSLSNSPAIFFKELNSNKLELMRLSSVSAPISNLTNGATVSVNLSSISKYTQNAR